MEVNYAAEFEKRYSELPNRIKATAERQEKLFRNNPFHPSLHTEKLFPKSKEVWSFRVDKNYRIVFKFLSGSSVVFLNIGHHHWIYRAKF